MKMQRICVTTTLLVGKHLGILKSVHRLLSYGQQSDLALTRRGYTTISLTQQEQSLGSFLFTTHDGRIV